MISTPIIEIASSYSAINYILNVSQKQVAHAIVDRPPCRVG